MRQPAVAGQFYEAMPDALRQQIKECFEKGPGLPDNKKNIKGVIVPHAGYLFSGRCAAYAYKELSLSKTLVIIGPDHYGKGSSISMEDWVTPLGTARNDKELAKQISDKTGVVIDEDAHISEHSIEVQLPFLKFLGDFKFVPIMISGDLDFSDVGKKLRGIDADFIISSDFTHYGPNFNYVPFTDNIKKNIEKLDKDAIKNITGKKPDDFRRYVIETGATICGFYPILVFLSMIKDTDLKGSLLNYYTSGDITGDFTNSVSYASIKFS